MARGHKRGGRQKGAPNKVTLKREAEIKASGMTPLDYLLSVMRDDKVDAAVRRDAAKAAAPYVHPRLSSVDLKAEVDTHEDWLDRLLPPPDQRHSEARRSASEVCPLSAMRTSC